jgi:hypothetical protein
MNKEKAAELRSLGEAHLYAAVAKADGTVSDTERRTAPHRAKKSQRRLNILGANTKVRDRIDTDVLRVLDNPKYAGWSAYMHLDEAVKLLRSAKESGDWAATMASHKNELELEHLARLEDYTFSESGMLKEIKRRLSNI